MRYQKNQKSMKIKSKKMLKKMRKKIINNKEGAYDYGNSYTKNKKYIVDIIDNGFEGEGIAKIDNFTIFIDGAIKGEKCKILIVKITSSHAFGKLLELIEQSPVRCTP